MFPSKPYLPELAQENGCKAKMAVLEMAGTTDCGNAWDWMDFSATDILSQMSPSTGEVDSSLKSWITENVK